MFRSVAITAVVAALASPALAETGLFQAVGLPLVDSAYVRGTKPACELPLPLSARDGAEPAALDHAMTLSPRMMQALRVDSESSVN